MMELSGKLLFQPNWKQEISLKNGKYILPLSGYKGFSPINIKMIQKMDNMLF